MKYGTDYKIAAYVGPHSATIALKKKNGLLSTIGDTLLHGNSTVFTGYLLTGEMATVRFQKIGKKWQVTITVHTHGSQKFIEFFAKTQSQYLHFIGTDYHGTKLPHQ
jgi:hypothetical protein